MILARTTGAVFTAALFVSSAAACSTKSDSTAAVDTTTIATTPRGTSTSGGATPSSPSTAEVSEAGDIPDNQVFVRFSTPGGAASVLVPEGWSQTQPAGATVFSDKYNSARIQTGTATASPTVDSAIAETQGELDAAGQQARDLTGTSVTRKSGDAILVTYTVTSEPNAVTGKSRELAVERYAFFRQGRSVTITLAGPTGADNVDPWRQITDSLQWS